MERKPKKRAAGKTSCTARNKEVHQFLKWTPIGIEKKIRRLDQRVSRLAGETPEERKGERLRLAHWSAQLREVQDRIDVIKKEVRPVLARDIPPPPASNELVLVAFFQPSTKNLFAELDVYFRKRGEENLSREITELGALADGARTLAWIGDAALNLAVLPEIWDPAISHVGILSKKRADYVQNANLARLCDRWMLSEHRIHFDLPADPGATTSETVAHTKGTLVEAIFGTVFLSGGLSAVACAIPLLRIEQITEGAEPL